MALYAIHQTSLYVGLVILGLIVISIGIWWIDHHNKMR